MELKQFIKDSVSQIAEAVEELNQENKDSQLVVNPASSCSHDRDFFYCSGSRNQTILNFHLVLSASEKNGSSAKVGVFTGWFGVRGDMDAINEGGNSTTLSFKLPVLLPQG